MEEIDNNQDNQQYEDCILCYDECRILGLGKCNHKPLCYKCVYKMRLLNQSKNCPICNSNNTEIIMTTRLDTKFEDYDLKKLKVYNEKMGIYSSSKECSQEMKKLSALKCFIPKCKEGDKEFTNQALFKKHMKDYHQRLLCDICLQNKKCLLNEQTLYTRNQLNRHMKYGDIDDQGNVYFFHPYCEFCDKYMYDEEALTTHMTNHFQCHICQENPENKYIYYNNYQSMEKHYRMSHYICEEEICLASCFIVFKTAQEQEMHNIKVHKVKTGNEALKAMVGFQYDDQNNNKNNQNKHKKKGGYFKDDGQIKDKEGIDFQQNFLSQQKQQFQVSVVDEHADDIFDFRELYMQKFDEEDGGIDENDLINSMLFTEGYRHIGSKKKHSKKDIIEKLRRKDGKDIYLEDLRFIKHNSQNLIKDYEFTNQMEQILTRADMQDYKDYKDDFYGKKLNPEDFFFNFIDICGPLAGYKLFPLFIRTVNNENLAGILDKIYLQNLQKLAKKQTTLINTCECYSEFFSCFLKEIEESLLHRIENKRLSLKKRIKMEKARMYQLIEILRRLKTPEMIKLKYLSNFGLSVEGIDYIIKKVYFAKLDKVQEKMQKVPTQDLLKLYMYVQICNDLVVGKMNKIQKRQVSSLVLKNFFQKYPEVVEKYCEKYRTHLSEESEEEENKQKEHQFYKGVKKAFENKKQHEFPDLVPQTKEEKERQKREQEMKEEQEKLQQQQEQEKYETIQQQLKATEQEKKYVEAKKNKIFTNKDKNQQQQQSTENLEYKVDYKKKQEVKERRVILDSDEEKQIKKQKDLDIQKQQLNKKPKKSSFDEDFMPLGTSNNQQQQQKQQLKQGELLTYDGSENGSSEEEEEMGGGQWGAGNKAIKKSKIAYEHANAAQRIKNETKNEEYFPTLGGGGAQVSAEQDIFEQMKKKPLPNKKSTQQQQKKKQSYQPQLQKKQSSNQTRNTYLDSNSNVVIYNNNQESSEEDDDDEDPPLIKTQSYKQQQQKKPQLEEEGEQQAYPDLLGNKQVSENDIYKKRQKKPKIQQYMQKRPENPIEQKKSAEQMAQEEGFQVYKKKEIVEDNSMQVVGQGKYNKKGKKQKILAGGFKF